jgi:hypothetical protein
MSREAVNQIIDRAVVDETFFEQLRTDPERAVQGFDLDPSEASAFKSGAYDVVVRATRKDREDQTALQTKRDATATATAARRPEPALAGDGTPPPAKAPVAGLVGFFIGLIVIGGGIGAFRYFESQWPWQALGGGKAAAPAAIPAPSLGSRAKPSAVARSAPASGAAASAASAAPSAPPSAPSATAKPGASASSGQAQLRPSASPPASAAAASNAQQNEAQKAYFQAVGARLAGVVKFFGSTLADLRAGNDPSKNLGDLSNAVADLRQHFNDAAPPDQLKQQHQALVQAIPLMQSDIDQLKGAVNQKNNVQAILISGEIGSLLEQLPDEVALATQPHPELYQPIDSSQQLAHILNFEVIGQNVTARNNAPAAVVLRIGMQSGNPSPDEVSDTLRHSVMAARQSFPQAGQVRVVAFKESNGAVGGQLGTADWYCSPDARPPDAAASAAWQDSCSKVYLSVPGANGGNATVPY